SLRETIAAYNKNRTLIRNIYALRKTDQPAVEGSEVLDLLIAGGALPPADFSTLLASTLKTVKERKPEKEKTPRILVWGSIMDDPTLYKMIEEAGGTVVADDTCIGFRVWEKDVPITEDLYDGLTEHYFLNFQCPRTDRGPGTGRFDYILERAREYKVDGVVGYSISFCDPHKFDYPDLRDYLKKEGLPMLLIDDNYSFEPAGAIKTRLQAFMEML
ncbi:MAG: 2-hydroxyacyl-CoA dehydratase family protein, partial [Dethiobacteria bacterium]|nr:2-hydroxyacyl-CoA dehydratase family protein [Dethiobacteria bacterium]